MPRCLSLFLCLLLLSSTITFGAVVQQDRETPVEDFETAPLQLSANDDGGKSPVFEQSHENPKSGTSCVKITYTGGDRWGNLQMPFHLTQETTGIRLWIRCQTCQPKSVMHLWLFESDGDGWVSPPIRLPMLDEGWNQVQFLLDDFTYQPRGNGKKDIQSTNRMLIGCNYADSIVYVDDIRLFTQPTSIQPRAKSGRLLGDFTFDLNKPSSDWWATLTAEYDPLQFMPESTSPNQGRRGMNESWWAVEQERVRKMGLHGMRLWFQIDWWEPTNDNDDPYHYAPDYSGFDIHGPRMESMYKFLDMCQKYNVAVQLDFGWKLDLPTRYWLAVPDQIKRAAPDISSPEEHAESVVALLHYLHDVKKYTCITHISLGNEFEYNYPSLYAALHKRLVAEHMRNQYVLVGLESNQGIAESKRLAAASPEIFDVHSLHHYGTVDLGRLLRQDIAELQKTKTPGAEPKFFGSRGRVFYTEFSLGPTTGTDVALAVISSAYTGAYGVGGWRLADQHLVSVCAMGNSNDRFDHGLHQWGTWQWIPWMKQPRPSYFATSLLTRYTRRWSKVYTPTQEMGKAKAVCFEKDGAYTIVVLNPFDEDVDVNLHFSKVVKERFHRHLWSQATLPVGNEDTVIPSDKSFPNSSIVDTLPPASFAVYTTFPDWPQLEVTPYVSVAHPGDLVPLTVRKIAYTGGIRWSVDGGNVNGTVSADGVYHAPKDLPAIDPVIVRATGRDDHHAVGLAVISFSGQPTDLPSRPSVTITPKVGNGSSRMFDLGTAMPLATVKKLSFQMENWGSEPAPYTIETTVPWLTVSSRHGEIAPNRQQTVPITVTVDTTGLLPEHWYRGYIYIRSPRGLGQDILDVFFKTAK